MNNGRRRAALLVVGLFLGASLACSVSAKDEKIRIEDLVARHLDAIGKQEIRANVKTLVVEGNVRARVISGGAGDTGGPLWLASQGHKFLCSMKFNVINYPGEDFAFDGQKKTLGFVQPGLRSSLETFLDTNGQILAEGLIGGTLSTAWPLYQWQDRQAKLHLEGIKKVDGKELYRVSYEPWHGSTNLKIWLFFDPETFRHVKTIYQQEIPPDLGPSVGRSSGNVTRNVLEEDFSEFQKVQDEYFPSRWTIKYTQEGKGNSITLWEMMIGTVQVNSDLSQRRFAVEQK